MDWENLTDLQHRSPPQFKHKIHLLMRYANDYDAAVVPDPYYGLNEGFNQVLDYCTDACGGLLETLERKARMMQKSLQAARAAEAAKAAQEAQLAGEAQVTTEAESTEETQVSEDK